MSITPLQVTDDGALSLTKINDNFDELDTDKVSLVTVGDLAMAGNSLFFDGGGQSEMLIADGNVYIQSRNNIYFGFTTTQMQFYSDVAMEFETTGGSNFFFGKSANKGILDFSDIASSNKTFTFPNKTGAVAVISDETIKPAAGEDLYLESGDASSAYVRVRAGVNGDVEIFPNGTGQVRLGDVEFTTGIGGNLTPTTDDSYSLGSSTRAWTDLYLEGFVLGNNGRVYAKDGTTELFRTTNNASAVNELTLTNAATGNAPQISATGDDTNINLQLTPKGTGKVVLSGNTVNVPTARTPASATATGTTGDICWDADYIYVCTATNTWMRAELNTW